jgi:hypothetical protein
VIPFSAREPSSLKLELKHFPTVEGDFLRKAIVHTESLFHLKGILYIKQ